MLRSLLRSLATVAVVSTAPLVAATAQTVALVDGRPVEAGDYEDWLLLNRGELMAGAFAEGRWIELRAAELGVVVSDAEVRERVEAEIQVRVANAFGGDRALWVDELERSRSSEEGYIQRRSREVRLELLGKAIVSVDRVVPDYVLRNAWQTEYGPGGVRARVRAIQLAIELVTPEGGWPLEDRRAAIERAQAEATDRLSGLLDRVRSGTASFSDLAFEFSDDPSAKDGGMLPGYFDPVGWPSQVVDGVTTTPEGGLVEPIAGRGGVWAFQVVSRIEHPLEVVRDEILAKVLGRGPENDEVSLVLDPELAELVVERTPALVAGEVTDRAAAALLIDGDAVSFGEYASWLRRFTGEELLPRYAEQLQLEKFGAELGLEPSPEAIEERIDENVAITVELQFKGDYQAWEANLAKNARTPESWRREARRRARLELITEGVIKRDRTFSEEQLRSAWIDRYGIEGMRVSGRLIAKQVTLPEREPGERDRAYERRVQQASEAALETLRELGARIEDGEDFAALAERYSDDRESAVLGGVPPGGFRLEDWSDGMREALLATPVGQFVQPRLEGDVAVLVEVLERTEVPFDSVREALLEELTRERVAVVDLAAFRNVLMRNLPLEVTAAMFD